MGAALAAVGVIVLGGSLAVFLPPGAQTVLLPLAAFVGGLLATLIVYAIASRGGHTDVPTLLLAGIALNAIASAGIGLFVFSAHEQQLRDLQLLAVGASAQIPGGKFSRPCP